MALSLSRKKSTESAEDKPVEFTPIEFTPTMPLANVLPTRIQEKVEQQAIIRRFVFLGVIMIAVFGVLWAGQTAQILLAQNSKNKAADITADLQAKKGTFSPVESYYTAVDGRLTDIQAAMSPEVEYGKVFEEVRKQSPNGVKIAGFTFAPVAADPAAAGGAAAAATCVNPDPFATVASLGCISFSGTAKNRAQVSQFIDNLKDNKLVTSPYVTTTATGDDGVTFSGTFVITPAVKPVDRYADPNFVTQGAGQ
jgi:hypothetical protein